MNLQKIIIAAFVASFSISSFADVNVNGYYRNDGTYVQPHHRSNPDGDPSNNWSNKGNTNPYTGEKGTHNPQNNLWNSN